MGPKKQEPLWLSIFHEDRAACPAGDREKARLCFEETIRLRPRDVPASLCLNRCRRFRKAFPPLGRQGISGWEET